jgi:acetyl esterase/lipase
MMHDSRACIAMVSEGLEFVINMWVHLRADEDKKRVEDSRKELEQLTTMIELPKGVKIERIKVMGVPAAWFSSPLSRNQCVIFYLHGGGYTEGSITTHQDLGVRLSLVSQARVLMIDYRLAPENPFPSGLEDAIKAYQWLINKEGIFPENVIIAGDSAGGGLTLATLVKLRDLGMALPAASLDELMFQASLYVADSDPRNPLISPLYADLTGLPPLLIQVGSAEILLDDSVRLAKRATAAGVDVQLDIWPDMIHVFQAFAAFAPEGQEGINKIGAFIQKFFTQIP